MTDPGNAPSWLFSFVDLAFLLLIAMTQLAADPRDPLPDLGSIEIPHIDEQARQSLESEAHERWQLRVHPDAADGSPFELAQLAGGEMTPGERLAYDGSPLPVAEDEIAGAGITTRDVGRGDHEHYLLKEISEAPRSFQKTLRGFHACRFG